MAAVTSSSVTLLDSGTFPLGTSSGKLYGTKARFSIALSSQGGTAGDITAALLGFKQIYKVSLLLFLTSGPANANVGVTIDSYASANNIITFTAIDGSTGPANLTGTLYIEVEGALN